MTYNIQEVANLFGITTNKIRFYEKKELIHPVRGEQNDYRYFSEEEIIRLQTILLYRSMGMRVSEIKKLLQDTSKVNYLEHFYKQWRIVNDEIHRLNAIRSSLERMMDGLYEAEEELVEAKVLAEIEKSMKTELVRNNWKDQWGFESWAKRYDKDVASNIGAVPMYDNYEALLEGVVEEAVKSIKKGDKVLDIGVGTGNLANRFFERGYAVVGVDQSRGMLEVAKGKNSKLKVRLGEFMKLPFEKDCFNAIVSTYAFHHLTAEEKECAVEEMFRVLKPGGVIVIGDLMFESEEEKQKIYTALTAQQIEEIEDEYYTDIKRLADYVRQQGRSFNKIRVDLFCWRIIIS